MTKETIEQSKIFQSDPEKIIQIVAYDHNSRGILALTNKGNIWRRQALYGKQAWDKIELPKELDVNISQPENENPS